MTVRVGDRPSVHRCRDEEVLRYFDLPGRTNKIKPMMRLAQILRKTCLRHVPKTLSPVTRETHGMNLLVGTLYTVENEFEECLASIARQTYRSFEHLIIRDLPKQEAHEALYGTFIERGSEFDLLVKIDADMVIPDPELFGKIVRRFQAEEELDLLLIGVCYFPCDELVTAVDSLFKHYRRNPDIRVAHGVLGVAAAFSRWFSVGHISHADDTLARHFEARYGALSLEEIHRAARRSHPFRPFGLPLDRRFFSKDYRFRARR